MLFRKMRHFKSKILTVTVGCTIVAVALLSAIVLSMVNTMVHSDADRNLIWQTRYYAKEFSLDLLSIEDKMKEVELHIKSTINLNALHEDGDGYLHQYEQTIAPFIERFANNRTAGIACWVYFDPKWSEKPHDIYYVDGNRDGKADRQAHIPFEYYDNTPTPTDDKEWWYGPLRTRKGFWTNPYEWALRDGEVIKVASYAVPIYVDNEFIGVLGTYYRFTKLADNVTSIKAFENGQALLFNEKLDAIIHPTLFAGTRNTSDNLATVNNGQFKELAEYVSSQPYGIMPYTVDGEERLFAFSKLSNGWTLAVNPPAREVYSSMYSLMCQIALGVVFCLVVAFLSAFALSRSILRPILEVVKSAEAIGKGDLDVVVSVDVQDETRTLATAINSMTAHMRRMTQKLTASYQRMQGVIEGAGMFTWDYDVRNQTVAHNAHFVRAVSYPGPVENGIISIHWLVDHAHPDDLHHLERLKGKLDRGAFVSFEIRLRMPSGQWRWFKNMGRVEECDEEGYVLRVAGTGFDIHEQKIAEFSEAERKQRLEDLVQQRTLELVESRNQAQAASDAKTVFLSTVSHEIRTPMNAILGFSHIFDRSNLTPSQIEYLDKIKLSAGALLNVINDVLDISKIESGKLELEETPFHLHSILDTVISIAGFTAREKGLELHVEVGANVPEIFNGDPKRLSQILLNLLNNAVKFTSKGSVGISVELEESAPQRLGYDCLTFRVFDTGIGLTEAQIGRLFRPFSQADSSVNRKYGGTGLGLAICKQLVEMMGGNIGVVSTPNSGSEFHFTLYLEPTDEAAPADYMQKTGADDAAQDTAVLKGKNVLLVEDNTINQEIARAFLDHYEVNVDVAENGQEALDMVQAKRYDLVFMDMQMPVMDGLESARRIRSTGDNPQNGNAWLSTIPIVAMTANAMAEDRARCLEAGMDDHIGKPIDPMALQRCLLHWITHRPE